MYKEYLKRFPVCVAGLALFALGSFCGVKAGSAGTNAWSTLSLGISGMSGVSYGTATFMISMVIIMLDLIGRGKLGFGTILNALLVPFFSDTYLAVFHFFLWLPMLLPV